MTEIDYQDGHFKGCVDKTATKNIENGYFRIVYNDGSIFEGFNENGKRNGYGRNIDKFGKVDERYHYWSEIELIYNRH